MARVKGYSFALVLTRTTGGVTDIQLRTGLDEGTTEDEVRGRVIKDGMQANPGYLLSIAHVWETYDAEADEQMDG